MDQQSSPRSCYHSRHKQPSVSCLTFFHCQSKHPSSKGTCCHHWFPPLSGGCQGNVCFPACWSMKCKVIAVQIQHKQMNLFFLQKPFVFILMQPHSTNINLFLQGFLQSPVPPLTWGHRAPSCSKHKPPHFRDQAGFSELQTSKNHLLIHRNILFITNM